MGIRPRRLTSQRAPRAPRVAPHSVSDSFDRGLFGARCDSAPTLNQALLYLERWEWQLNFLKRRCGCDGITGGCTRCNPTDRTTSPPAAPARRSRSGQASKEASFRSDARSSFRGDCSLRPADEIVLTTSGPDFISYSPNNREMTVHDEQGVHYIDMGNVSEVHVPRSPGDASPNGG